jgi:hypothetical protein
MRFTLILFFIVAIVSCNSLTNQEQEILNEEKMATVIYDVLLAESFAESYLMKDTMKNKDSTLQIEMDKVLKVHSISSQTFAKSYRFYKSNPLTLERILDSANERAVRERTDVFLKRNPIKKR